MVKITFMGTSHGYAEKDRFTSATLIEVSDFYYLLDAGAPVEWIMVNADKPCEKIRGIFITHMHNDHVGSLTSIIEPMLRYRYNNNAVCFFPTENGKDSFLDWMKALHLSKDQILSTVEMGVTKEGRIYERNGLTVSAKYTKHIENESFSYVFEADGKKVLFTGDMKGGFQEYPDIIGEEHYDLVVCEMAHTPLCKAQEILKQTNTKRMIITHCYMPMIEGHEQILKTFPFPVSLAKDGDEVIL